MPQPPAAEDSFAALERALQEEEAKAKRAPRRTVPAAAAAAAAATPRAAVTPAAPTPRTRRAEARPEAVVHAVVAATGRGCDAALGLAGAKGPGGWVASPFGAHAETACLLELVADEVRGLVVRVEVAEWRCAPAELRLLHSAQLGAPFEPLGPALRIRGPRPGGGVPPRAQTWRLPPELAVRRYVALTLLGCADDTARPRMHRLRSLSLCARPVGPPSPPPKAAPDVAALAAAEVVATPFFSRFSPTNSTSPTISTASTTPGAAPPSSTTSKTPGASPVPSTTSATPHSAVQQRASASPVTPASHASAAPSPPAPAAAAPAPEVRTPTARQLTDVVEETVGAERVRLVSATLRALGVPPTAVLVSELLDGAGGTLASLDQKGSAALLACVPTTDEAARLRAAQCCSTRAAPPAEDDDVGNAAVFLAHMATLPSAKERVEAVRLEERATDAARAATAAATAVRLACSQAYASAALRRVLAGARAPGAAPLPAEAAIAAAGLLPTVERVALRDELPGARAAASADLKGTAASVAAARAAAERVAAAARRCMDLDGLDGADRFGAVGAAHASVAQEALAPAVSALDDACAAFARLAASLNGAAGVPGGPAALFGAVAAAAAAEPADDEPQAAPTTPKAAKPPLPTLVRQTPRGPGGKRLTLQQLANVNATELFSPTPEKPRRAALRSASGRLNQSPSAAPKRGGKSRLGVAPRTLASDGAFGPWAGADLEDGGPPAIGECR